MPWVKSDGWPVVLPDDDGLRASRPGACFYCGSAVGTPHGRECVTVSQLVRWGVYVGGVRRGHYDYPEIAGREVSDWEFARNEGSWCAGNAVEWIVWDGAEPPEVAAAESCCCDVLEFRYEQVIDAGPLVMRPKDVTPPGAAAPGGG